MSTRIDAFDNDPCPAARLLVMAMDCFRLDQDDVARLFMRDVVTLLGGRP